LTRGSRKLLRLYILIAAVTPGWSQTVTPGRATFGRLCVARVANSSGKPIAVDDMQQQLVEQLVRRKIDAVAAPTMTMLASRLALTPSNREAFPALKCDYLLLTEIASSPVSEQNSLAVRFSIFDKARQPMLETSVPAAGENSGQATMAATSTVAGRVASALDRKKR
jgi:hypothetical protein